MIKTIHIVWIGDESKRPDNYINTWIDLNPEWKVRVWGNEDLFYHFWINQKHINELMKVKKYHAVADMMRYEILYRHGGLCIDADLKCVRPIEDWLFQDSTVFCYENEETRGDMLAVTMMYSIPGRNFFLEVIHAIKNDPEVLTDWPFKKTGPHRLTKMYEREKPDSVKILPSYHFIPNHFDAPAYDGEGPVFADHAWGTTRESYDHLYKEGKKLKICVYAISKNEAHFVQRFCESAIDADYILIADTGSTDGTDVKARIHGAHVHNICITPWRFDHARNAAIALIPRDIDICISLDLDEVMEPGWREEIERVWKSDTTRLRYYFDWGCGIKFKYEKIHARHGYFWHHPCHEYPVNDKRIKEVWAETDKLLVSHHPDPTKSRGQYMDLLELSVKEDPHCPRNAFYYARELSFNGRWQESIEACEKYLKMPEATWPNERCYAMRVMGKCYEHLNQHWMAEKWYQMAAAEAPNTREPWCALAMLYYFQRNWVQSYAAAMRALTITNRELVYTCDPEVWGPQPHDLAAVSAWHMGLKDKAIEQGELALSLNPSDNRLQENLLWFRGEKTAVDDG